MRNRMEYDRRRQASLPKQTQAAVRRPAASATIAARILCRRQRRFGAAVPLPACTSIAERVALKAVSSSRQRAAGCDMLLNQLPVLGVEFAEEIIF